MSNYYWHAFNNTFSHYGRIWKQIGGFWTIGENLAFTVAIATTLLFIFYFVKTWQFSLRSAFVGMTLVGFWCWYANQWVVTSTQGPAPGLMIALSSVVSILAVVQAGSIRSAHKAHTVKMT